MTDNGSSSGREIADLLPWYATSKLSETDRRRVAAALTSDPGLQRELTLIEEEKDAAIRLNEALDMPSRQATRRFNEMLDAMTHKPRIDVVAGIGPRLRSWFSAYPAWGALAAAAIIVAQASIIGTMIWSHTSTYAVSSIDPVSAGRVESNVVIAFDQAASVGAIQNMLQRNGASIVEGPLPGGLFRLHVGDHALTKAEIADIVDRLKTLDNLVRFVSPESPSN